MAVFSLREQMGTIGEEVPINSLASHLPVLQLWKDSLMEFFFGKEGILVNTRSGASQYQSYLVINCSYVLAQNSLLGEELARITLTSRKYSLEGGLDRYLKNVKENIAVLMHISRRREGKNVRIVCLKINNLFFPVKILNFSAFIQLLASLLQLYKDVLACSVFTLEDEKRQLLKEALEQLAERPCEEGERGALKEMFVQAKKWNDACLEEKNRLGLASPKVSAFFLYLIDVGIHMRREEQQKSEAVCPDLSNEEDVVRWLECLPEKDFIYALEEIANLSPMESLKEVLKNKPISTWKIILSRLSIPLLGVIPLDELQQVLMEISHKNMLDYISSMSLEMLRSILQEMPKEILGKILLEIPHGIVCDLKQRMRDMPLKEQLMREINEKLSELQLLGKGNQLSQKDKTRSVASLLSLSAIAICSFHKGAVVGGIEQSLDAWGPSYIEMLLKDHPEIEKNIKKSMRVVLRPLYQEGAPELVFERCHHPEYSQEHDLFPLASMKLGYDDFIKKALIKRCEQD
ncbi:hypothetical protein CLAVI_000322 [Candidatus Clavichlamydia salmonicola]|uniref:hypothetical protein n=1 Tax=Candidatus Clavichlamydia salmonicola TaxID=469812 RepID=UPI0018916173|nr:hypothetical protein [Candidatus Clavichlamydia salmonicola]MBF5050707.1 hypothetical protein [Candidatus Clavichlamydia salmonicola]